MNRSAFAAASFALLGSSGAVAASDRLPTIPPSQYSPEQQRAAGDFEAARHGKVFGPFEPLMHSPDVMTLSRSMGDYLRFKSAIGTTLSELVILMVAREWTQDFEWSYHYPIALKAGISKEVADAIGDGRRPASMTVDEEMVYEYTTELLKSKRVSDLSFGRVKARFGEKGVVDLTGIAGYYTFLAMQLNAAQYKTSDNGPGLKRLPE
ncbi:MAG: carboxymuconolactone decarboxylase family protein [Pseudomonadota bacterium]|nr:carboxymuconolactone decarboxylase family protein [Pseudomonadota bacterium]